LGCTTQVSASSVSTKPNLLHVSENLEPAGTAANPADQKISPAGKPASSRPLRSKFFRRPHPSLRFGRSQGSR
jgi:hypothetical protein